MIGSRLGSAATQVLQTLHGHTPATQPIIRAQTPASASALIELATSSLKPVHPSLLLPLLLGCPPVVADAPSTSPYNAMGALMQMASDSGDRTLLVEALLWQVCQHPIPVTLPSPTPPTIEDLQKIMARLQGVR